MNAYRIDIWCSIHHNGNFSHNISRVVIIHSRNEKEARNKIRLKPNSITEMPDLKIESGNEWIYSCEKLGTVKIEPFYVYSNGRSPISVSSYREYIKRANK